MLQRHRIVNRPTTSRNPQANAICERMHQAVGNTLRAMATMTAPPTGVQTIEQMVDTALADCMYATRAALHGTLHASPESLAFSRDMILDIPMVADWLLLQQRRQALIDQRLIEANRKRFGYDYQINDEVLKIAYNPNKLAPRAAGPYRITQVHTNGTVTIQLTPTTVERISIRRVKPYHR